MTAATPSPGRVPPIREAVDELARRARDKLDEFARIARRRRIERAVLLLGLVVGGYLVLRR
jgi:hypothetical protein